MNHKYTTIFITTKFILNYFFHRQELGGICTGICNTGCRPGAEKYCMAVAKQVSPDQELNLWTPLKPKNPHISVRV